MDSQNMIYVDLNSIMHSNTLYLSKWYHEFGMTDKAEKYEKISNYILESIEHVSFFNNLKNDFKLKLIQK